MPINAPSNPPLILCQRASPGDCKVAREEEPGRPDLQIIEEGDRMARAKGTKTLWSGPV